MSKKANTTKTPKATKGTSTALPTAVLNRLAADSNAALAAKGELNEKTAAPAAPAEKPLVDLTKISTKNLKIALNQETSMRPSVAMAYRQELEKREAAAKAAPAAKKPAAKPADTDSLELHLNNTGRLCFGRHAAARLTEAGFPIDAEYFMTMAIDKGTVRLEPTSKALDGALTVRDGGGRPYISATKQFKQHGFAASAGGAAYSIEAKPYGKAGFEFRLPKMA